MSNFYRIVATDWSKGKPKNKVYDNLLIAYNGTARVEDAMRHNVLADLLFLNEGDPNISHRHSFSGDFDCTIQYWDGKQYHRVLTYDIHGIGTDGEYLEKGTYYHYRGFYIYPNEKHTSFKVEQNGTVLCRKRKLENAFIFIDEFCLAFDNR